MVKKSKFKFNKRFFVFITISLLIGGIVGYFIFYSDITGEAIKNKVSIASKAIAKKPTLPTTIIKPSKTKTAGSELTVDAEKTDSEIIVRETNAKSLYGVENINELRLRVEKLYSHCRVGPVIPPVLLYDNYLNYGSEHDWSTNGNLPITITEGVGPLEYGTSYRLYLGSQLEDGSLFSTEKYFDHSACNDCIDNDEDGPIDLDDPGCFDINDDDEIYGIGECRDGIDNDGDGWTDEHDLGCTDANDGSETNTDYECDNGLDDDGDGKIDFKLDRSGDLGCSGIMSNSEINNGDGVCSWPEESCIASDNNYARFDCSCKRKRGGPSPLFVYTVCRDQANSAGETAVLGKCTAITCGDKYCDTYEACISKWCTNRINTQFYDDCIALYCNKDNVMLPATTGSYEQAGINFETCANCPGDCGVCCGNGVIDAGEECDDGNTNDNDACLNNCANARCGDSVVQIGVEECDVGSVVPNSRDSWYCNTACKLRNYASEVKLWNLPLTGHPDHNACEDNRGSILSFPDRFNSYYEPKSLAHVCLGIYQCDTNPTNCNYIIVKMNRDFYNCFGADLLVYDVKPMTYRTCMDWTGQDCSLGPMGGRYENYKVYIAEDTEDINSADWKYIGKLAKSSSLDEEPIINAIEKVSTDSRCTAANEDCDKWMIDEFKIESNAENPSGPFRLVKLEAVKDAKGGLCLDNPDEWDRFSCGPDLDAVEAVYSNPCS